MSLFSMQYLEPQFLPTYVTLIENYLRDEMFKYEQKYRDLEQNHKKIIKNYDVEMYTLRINNQTRLQQESEAEEEIRDDNLLRRIEQYNRIAKPNKSRDKDKNRRNRRNAQGQQGKPKRKVRTTITPAKLQQMNRIFKQYLQNQEKNKDAQDQEGLLSVESDRQAEYGSLKLIGQRLGLGYSTILHKFREYRATRKVKGGALIASINHKRKYKKSREIEQLIQRSLAEKTFYTAVELSRHIQTKYNKTLSRSIISRHLGQMGYSYKNIKTTKPTNRNTNCIKQLRRNFAAALSMQKEQSFAQVYYLDEIVLTYDETNKKINQSVEQDDDQPLEVHLTLVATKEQGIVKYNLASEAMQQQEFLTYIKEIEQTFLEQEDSKTSKILMMDLQNSNHLCESIIQIRKRIKQKNVRIFYQPPHSNQLNLLQWFGIDLKRILSGRSYSTFDQFRDHILEILTKNSMTSMENYFNETQQYIKRSMIMQNF